MRWTRCRWWGEKEVVPLPHPCSTVTQRWMPAKVGDRGSDDRKKTSKGSKRLGLLNEFLKEASYSELKRKVENSKEWRTWKPRSCLTAMGGYLGGQRGTISSKRLGGRNGVTFIPLLKNSEMYSYYVSVHWLRSKTYTDSQYSQNFKINIKTFERIGAVVFPCMPPEAIVFCLLILQWWGLLNYYFHSQNPCS